MACEMESRGDLTARLLEWQQPMDCLPSSSEADDTTLIWRTTPHESPSPPNVRSTGVDNAHFQNDTVQQRTVSAPTRTDAKAGEEEREEGLSQQIDLPDTMYFIPCHDGPAVVPSNDDAIRKTPTVTTMLAQAESDVEASLQKAMTVIEEKKAFLLRRLSHMRKARESDIKLKTPIQTPQTHSEESTSEDETDKVFVRKKVVRNGKGGLKNDMKMMSEIEDIISKCNDIAFVAKGMRYMAPFLDTVIESNMADDNECPDLVDVEVLTVDEQDVVLVTDFKNMCLKSFCDISGNVVKRVLKFGNSPWGLTKMTSDTVAVSVPMSNQICIVLVTAGLQISSKLKTRKRYYGLVAIGSSVMAATSPYSSPRSVDLIDLSGTVHKTLAIDSLVEQPSFIATLPTGSYVVTDLAKGRVLSLTRSLCIEAGYELEGAAKLFSSRGVAANQEGDVFIVDYQQKKVKVFTREGRFLKDFLTCDDGLKYPYGVCFDSTGRSYVTDGGTIKVYTY